jgi:hypothetical protein
MNRNYSVCNPKASRSKDIQGIMFFYQATFQLIVIALISSHIPEAIVSDLTSLLWYC